MRLEGYLKKPEEGEKYWGVEIPSLGIFTQGKSKKDALFMAKDAIEFLVDARGFFVSVTPGKNLEFYISASDLSPLISLLLKRKRLERGLTIMDVAERMGSQSPTAYARYEKGKVKPSLDKLDQILKAIDKDLEPILKIS